MEKKNKTAKVAKTKERRISNKKVESLHKYWEAFPGLKRRLIQPVEGENYSLIKPNDVEKAVYANAGVKRAVDYIRAFTSNNAESYVFSLSHRDNMADYIPEVFKNVAKDEARGAYSVVPVINLREILKGIDRLWPLAAEYYKTCKDGGGIMACKKHPLFISAMKELVAKEMIEKGGGSKIPPVYFSVPYGNLINEKAKYIIYPKSFLMVSEEMKKFVQRELDNCIQYDEILTTEVNRRIDNLDETEIKRIAYEAFFVELNTLVQFQFHDSLCRLIEKLSA